MKLFEKHDANISTYLTSSEYEQQKKKRKVLDMSDIYNPIQTGVSVLLYF